MTSANRPACLPAAARYSRHPAQLQLPELLPQLHRQPLRVHNICIVAHVDHGKTTLADSLLAAGGLISRRLAGQLRYLDSRPDEQQRGITMKSSAIALLHWPTALCRTAGYTDPTGATGGGAAGPTDGGATGGGAAGDTGGGAAGATGGGAAGPTDGGATDGGAAGVTDGGAAGGGGAGSGTNQASRVANGHLLSTDSGGADFITASPSVGELDNHPVSNSGSDSGRDTLEPTASTGLAACVSSVSQSPAACSNGVFQDTPGSVCCAPPADAITAALDDPDKDRVSDDEVVEPVAEDVLQAKRSTSSSENANRTTPSAASVTSDERCDLSRSVDRHTSASTTATPATASSTTDKHDNTTLQLDSQPHLINLIDSPGHVDFGTEVSTALCVCDGTLLLVDVVEGVCAQTRQALRHIWAAGIRPLLVLNKLDRLIVEKAMSPVDAYHTLAQVLETVNAVVAELCTALHVSQQQQQQPETTPPSPPPAPSVTRSSPAVTGSEDPSASASTTPGGPLSSVDVSAWSLGLESMDETSVYFTPEAGNVLFASGQDGWAFTLDQFAAMYASDSPPNLLPHQQPHQQQQQQQPQQQLVNATRRQLRTALWDSDCYVSARRGVRRVERGARAKCREPLFARLVLAPVWQVYDAAVLHTDPQRLQQLAARLGLSWTGPGPGGGGGGSGRQAVRALMGQWLPLAAACLDAVVTHLPSAGRMTRRRADCLMTGPSAGPQPLVAQQKEQQQQQEEKSRRHLRDALMACSSSQHAPLVVLVAKMFAVSRQDLPELRPRPLSAAEIAQRRQAARERHAQLMSSPAHPAPPPGESPCSGTGGGGDTRDQPVFLGFGRVLSGCLRPGDQVCVLDSRHTSSSPPPASSCCSAEGPPRCRVTALYLLMGRQLESLAEAPAGTVVGIGGLAQHVLRAAVLTDSPRLAAPLVAPLVSAVDASSGYCGGEPIMRVALEPHDGQQLPQLVVGLRQLQQADPAVRVSVERSGEYVLGVAGEVHLQRCLTDLSDRFARNCPLTVSSPIVPFRETVVLLPPPSAEQSSSSSAAAGAVLPLSGGGSGDERCCVHSGGAAASIQVQLEDSASAASTGAEQNTDAGKSVSVIFSARALPLCAEAVTLLEHWALQLGAGQPPIPSQRSELPADPFATSCQLVDADSSCSDEREKSQVEAGEKTTHSATDISGATLTSSISTCSGTLSQAACPEALGQHSTPFHNQQQQQQLYVRLLELINSGNSHGNAICRRCHDSRSDQILSVCSTNVLLHTGPALLVDDQQQQQQEEEQLQLPKQLVAAVCHGFRLACQTGPLCDEPLRAVLFVVDRLQLVTAPAPPPVGGGGGTSSVSSCGQLMSAARQVFRRAVRGGDSCCAGGAGGAARLMLAMYRCEVCVETASTLGRLYAAIGRRGGRVVHGDASDETGSRFRVTAYVPVVESGQLASELRKQTSGLAAPQLQFSHWQLLAQDPLADPLSAAGADCGADVGEEAEAEQDGGGGGGHNLARRYMNAVRMRKGLHIDEQLVRFGEKQRTLARKK